MRVLTIILEAAEIDLIDRWSDELPTFSSLRAESAGFRLTSHSDLLADSVLAEISCGRSAAATGVYVVTRQLHTGEKATRDLTFEEQQALPYYWTAADRAGRRVTVLDHSWGSPGTGYSGYFVKGYGLHQVTPGPHCVPATAIAELQAACGTYPVKHCDLQYDRTLTDHVSLLNHLEAGLPMKEQAILEQMQRQEWDLFSTTISELHCTGHQFWYLHDTTHPDHPAQAPTRLKDAMRSMYVAVDATLGRIIDAADHDVTTMLVIPRGMQAKAGGEQMLPEFLHRLGLGSGRWLRMKLGFIAPRPMKTLVRRVVPQSVLDRMHLGLNSRMGTFGDNETKVIAIDNAGVGCLRVNVLGREYDGCVRPGAEYDDLIECLREELTALRDLRTGEPAIERLVTPAELFGRDYHPDLPDLIVAFRTDLGVMAECISPTVGTLRRPDPPTRTGDHTRHGRMWIKGDGIAPTQTLLDARPVDVAPTMLDLLDVPGDETWDGRSVLPSVSSTSR